MSNTAVNTCVQVFMRTYVFIALEYRDGSEMLDHGVTLGSKVPVRTPAGKV